MAREDAERFLIELDGKLGWESDEGISAPPLDRVGLAGRFLAHLAPMQSAPNVPFNESQLWEVWVGMDWLRSADSDLLTDRIWIEHGKPSNTEELFLLLERIYEARWRRGWLCGASPEAMRNVHRELLVALRAVTCNSDATFDEAERVGDQITPAQGRDLCWEIDWVGYEGRTLLVTEAKSFLTEMLEMGLIFGGLLLVLLALLGYLNGWIAVLGFIGLVGLVSVTAKKTGDFRWRQPTLTFGELVSQLQERARDEYEEMKGAAHDAG
ncbi:hypothetical protein [Armatimonas sp.]|uniref:hypothetical protein n=1 Tax=Armatimonas sp. TaxID=1872638 RepID=UPI00374D0E2B